MNRRNSEFFQHGGHLYGHSREGHYQPNDKNQLQPGRKSRLADDVSYSLEEACPLLKFFFSSQNREITLRLATEAGLAFDPIILSAAVLQKKFPVTIEQNGRKNVYECVQDINKVAMQLYQVLYPATYKHS